MTLVLDRGGTSMDHVAIGVPDTEKGVALVSEQLGFTPTSTEPPLDQFYWSHALSLGSGRFLEILGPNPLYRGFNPFMEMVKQLKKPCPLFWYIATDDFSAFVSKAKQIGSPVWNIQTIKRNIRGVPTDFTRGIIGPGFLSVCPNVIEWRKKHHILTDGEGPEFLGLELAHPEAIRLNRIFQDLGINQNVTPGPHRVGLKLATPKGEAEFIGDGLELRGASAVFRMTSMFFKWLLNRRLQAAEPN